jgi:cytochrome c553
MRLVKSYLAFAIVASVSACSPPPPQPPPPAAPAMSPVERGQYIVTTGLCNDCHTPAKMGPNGPEPDMDRLLSGHPETLKVTPTKALPAGWLAMGSLTFTAWQGPWGVSFTANLTPDQNTGLGVWTEDMFIQAMRTGKHMGNGRDILPPMPWQWIGKYSDDDLKAIFAYLKSIKPVANRVPDPLPPAGAKPAAD